MEEIAALRKARQDELAAAGSGPLVPASGGVPGSQGQAAGEEEEDEFVLLQQHVRREEEEQRSRAQVSAQEVKVLQAVYGPDYRPMELTEQER
jgi:hypothetical protein